MTPRNPQDTGDPVIRGRKPFAMIPTDLVRDPAISSSAVRLWTVLASHAHGSDVVTRPSRATLARDCGHGSTRAVDLNLRQLERTGWLSIESTQRTDGGRGNNRYDLEWEPRVPAVVPYQTAELAEFEISTHHRRRVVLVVAVAVLLVAIGFLAGRAGPEEPDDCMAPLLATSAPLPHGLALDLRSENGAMALSETLGRLRTPSV